MLTRLLPCKNNFKVLVVISYDVSTTSSGGSKRLRSISRACQDYGQRVQFSIFECQVDPAQWAELKSRLLNLFNPEVDSLRFYYLGREWEKRIEHVGAKQGYNPKGTLVF
jgi:CRISPR-associated protein Cas2